MSIWNGGVAQLRLVLISARQGIVGATVATLCCAPPAIAFALGLGGSAFLVGFARLRPYFMVAGLAVVIAASWRLIWSMNRCTVREQQSRLTGVALALVTFALGYWVISYQLLPWLYTVR